jgi:hypothetical protein
MSLYSGGRVAMVGGERWVVHERCRRVRPTVAHVGPATADGVRARACGGLVAVAGGMVLVGGDPESGEELQALELFDEASGQWFELSHQPAEPHNGTCVVSVPAAPAPAAQRTTQ